MLASGSDQDNLIIIWDLKKRSAYKKMAKHSAAVVSLEFSDDSTYLLSGSFDTSIIIWNIFEGEAVQKLKGHQNSVNCCIFSTDYHKIISGGLDNTINIWKIKYQ